MLGGSKRLSSWNDEAVVGVNVNIDIEHM
jgi:hypothetical protein